MPRKSKGLLRKQGDHSAANMLRALQLTRSGMSIRKASMACGIAYATLRRYVIMHMKVPSEHLATKKLTPHYDNRKIFTPEQENHLISYCEQTGLKFNGLAKDCRRVAYEMAVCNNLAVPNSWKQNECAGIEWFRSFKQRHPELSTTDQASKSELEQCLSLVMPAGLTPKKPKLELLSSEDERGWICEEIVSENEEHFVNIEVCARPHAKKDGWTEAGRNGTEDALDGGQLPVGQPLPASGLCNETTGYNSTEQVLESQSESQDGIPQDNENRDIKIEIPDPIQQEELLTKENSKPTDVDTDGQREICTDTVDPLQSETKGRTGRMPRSSRLAKKRLRDRSPSTESIEEPEFEHRTPLNEQNEAQSLRRKMLIMEKEFRESQKRARELHSLEIQLMKEKIREARAKADLAELLLQQQKEKEKLLTSYVNGDNT